MAQRTAKPRPTSFGGRLALIVLAGAVLAGAVLADCSSGHYVEPTEGPAGTIEIASICTQRASFVARINGQRTERHGCNETASWQVVPGRVELVVQVEQATFVVDPLTIEFEIGPQQCARFLLRQSDGYELEFFGVGACE